MNCRLSLKRRSLTGILAALAFCMAGAATGADRAAADPSAQTPRGAAQSLADKKPPAAKEEKSKDAPHLPGGHWDVSALDKKFTILKTKHDDAKNTVSWLLEAKDGDYASFFVSFYDEDEVKVGTAVVTFDPNLSSVNKDERTRGTVTLLAEEQMKKVVKVVVGKR